MIYFTGPNDCPNRAKLAKMTAQEACGWSMEASTHVMEISRRAEVQAFYGLTPRQEQNLYEATLDDITVRDPKTYRTELTPAGEQTVIPGCERDAAPGVRQLSLF